MTEIDKKTTKCPYCGGLLRRSATGVVKCTCCDSEFKTETVDADLFAEAESLRFKNKFGEALDKYESVLSVNPDSVEANWGALLAEFGIEYVKEGKEEIPTIHRPLYGYSIIDDKYACAILDNTAGTERDEYYSKLRSLEDLRIRIEKEACKYKKYDVFISCKITGGTDTEEKTEEYVWAEALYKKLTKRGLVVFFSPYSLPSSNGDYEPIIYSALQSAKYLVVLASSCERLNSTWIRNEWGRFLENRKLSEDRKYYKLIVKNGVIKNIPTALRDTSAIAYDDKGLWLKYAEEAVVDAFPDRELVPYIERVDLSEVKIGKNKTLSSAKTVDHFIDGFAPQNPYSVRFYEPENSYETDNNVVACVEKCKAFLRCGNYREAEREIRNFLNYCGDKVYDYNILTLELLIKTRKKSLEDFFETGLSDLTDFDLLNEIVRHIPADAIDDFVTNIGKYIMNSIASGENNNAIGYYNIVKDVKTDIVTTLNCDVLRSLPHLYGNPDLFMKYAEAAIPFVAGNSVNRYIEIVTDLVAGMCKNEMWEGAEKLASGLIAADPHNAKILFVNMMIEKKASSRDALFDGVEKTFDYVSVENLLSDLSSVGCVHFADVLKSRIMLLIKRAQYNEASEWIDILKKITFENKEQFFASIVDKCKNDYRSVPTFFAAIHTFGEDKLNFFIESMLRYINVLVRNGRFTEAKKLCDDLAQYDVTNVECYRYKLYAEIESSTYSFDNIYKLKDETTIENLLIATSSEYERNEVLRKLAWACVKYVSGADSGSLNKNVFFVFDRLLGYYVEPEKTDDVKKIVTAFAKGCLNVEEFERAKWYFSYLTGLDKTLHEAYWGIILAETNSKNNDELALSGVRIDSFKEYTFAVMYAKDNEKAEDEYAAVVLKQRALIKKKKIRFVPFLAAGVIVIAITILWIVL